MPRVQIVPLPDDQVSFQVEGVERLRWHHAARYPRPFFYPLVGPSGRSLTRMGHPAAPDHDHHNSFWFAHTGVGGVDFWAQKTVPPQVRQEAWVHYQDGDDEAGIVVRLAWIDAHKSTLLHLDLITVLRPLDGKESWIELQCRLTTPLHQLKFDKTNFGLMGLRVAASLSAQYGGGRLRNSVGDTGEKALFTRQADWVDYSGPIVGTTWEGITWFDHPSNINYPSSWHVRDDGWMSPAFTLRDAVTLERTSPQVLRYGLHLHAGDVQPKNAVARHKAFASSPPWEVVAARRPWRVTLRRKS
ncbi:MAG: PmoA family protein [Gemmataceae bacterium]